MFFIYISRYLHSFSLGMIYQPTKSKLLLKSDLLIITIPTLTLMESVRKNLRKVK